MHYYLTGKQARDIDRYTSETIGMPGVVLMERAALELAGVVSEEIERKKKLGIISAVGTARNVRILSIVGTGNNGGDAVAAARILKMRGFNAYVYEVNPHGKKTDSFLIQEKIAKNLEVEFLETLPDSSSPKDLASAFESFDVIIDGIFGVGLTREIAGIYKNVVEGINLASERNTSPAATGVTDSYMTGALKSVVACDIPSGIGSDNGCIMGCAVKCDVTVTFGYTKFGMLINDGRTYSGRIICKEIGLYIPKSINEAQSLFEGTVAFEYDMPDLKYRVPACVPDAYKGTNGKVLIVAGSKDIFGAMYLCTSACCHVGAGLVKVVTHERNRDLLMDKLPEVMTLTYADSDLMNSSESFSCRFMESIAWADTVLVGPGLGTGEQSRAILRPVMASLKEGQRLVLDADALNMFSDMFPDTTFDATGAGNIVLTPHIGEMIRLMKGLGRETSSAEIKKDPIEAAQWVSKATGAVCILKDARTVVANPEDDGIIYVNTTGNCGMSKGGSGDVLAGIMAGLLARTRKSMMTVYETACVAVNIHGRAGDRAKDRFGETVMMAGNIINEIGTADLPGKGK